MAIVIKSGLVALVTDVRAYFVEHEVTAKVSLGWKERTKQINQGPGRANRVVFTPSDDSGRGGKIVAAKQPGNHPVKNELGAIEGHVRPLRNWERIVVVSVWAVDATDAQSLQDEEKQIEATETLFEWVLRAVHQSVHVNGQWGDVIWTTDPVEHLFGRELRVSLLFSHPLYDRPTGMAYPANLALTKTLNEEAG